MQLSNDELMALRNEGFIPLKDKEHFAVRVVIPAGIVTADYAQILTEVATLFGRGYYTLTQRLDVEIPWIEYTTIPLVAQVLKAHGLQVGGTGFRIRPIHTCKGSVCRMSLFDADKVALTMHHDLYQKYYDTTFPNKLTITVGGCFNSCSRPQAACIGLIGKRKDQVAILIGGSFGRHKHLAQELDGLYTIPEALAIVERAVLFYRDNAHERERFYDMLERLGFEAVQQALCLPPTF